MRLSNLVRPARWRDGLLMWLARSLRPYLARTPLYWGDESNVKIGKNVHLVDTILNSRSGRIVIEDDVFFGHGVMLLTGSHDMRVTGSKRHSSVPEEGRDIRIGRGAWIASNVVVVGPCEIGEDAVVGAGLVVTGKIEAGHLVVGGARNVSKPIAFEDPNKK